MQIESWQSGQDFIVYDRDQIAVPSLDLFDPQWWEREGLRLGVFRGRGQVHVVRHDDRRWVLRRYRRGGVVGRMVDRSYVWAGLESTRPWREWHLLAELRRQRLPVPRPIAAHVARDGWRYSGHILSELIEDARPLAEVLNKEGMTSFDWRRLGETLQRFHRAGVHHPDLNVQNILLHRDGRFFFIDFDKGSLQARRLQLDLDLQRFRRSVDKTREKAPQIRFQEPDWDVFMEGYRSA